LYELLLSLITAAFWYFSTARA